MLTDKDVKTLAALVGKYGFRKVVYALHTIASTYAETAPADDIKAYYNSVAGGLEESSYNLGSGLV